MGRLRSDSLLQIYQPIYDVLFNSRGILTAQAAIQVGDPADYPFDQVSARFPNRARVGFISSVDSGLDEFGRGTVHLAQQYPANGDAHAYFNWRCEVQTPEPLCADPHYEFVGPFGLGVATVPFMSSSYVDPLGLARLIHLRYSRHASEAMSDALIQTLRQELTPSLCGDAGTEPCVYQDPIAHRQLEPYRLGYDRD